jgi:hypothetical protein
VTATPPKSYNPFRSLTTIGATLAGIANVVKQVAPQYAAAATIAETVGGMLAAHGVRKAIAKNGAGK